MRPRRVPAAPPSAMLALGIVFGLAGCVPSTPAVTPAPEPSVAPIFAGDEEALAAAEEAYGRYLEVSGTILQQGGEDAQRLSGVATGEFLERSIESFEEFRDAGLRLIGDLTFESIALQQYDRYSHGTDVVVVYTCEVVGNTDVVDASGASRVSDARPERSLFEVRFDMHSDGSQLLVSDKEEWRSGTC